MHLLLIRHGESVDNVAGLYGGSRDAALTTHGVLQAQRLASSLVESSLEVKHVFASNLERAARTAQAVCDSQNKAHTSALVVVQLPELREKHFGNWEGVKFASAASEQRPTQMGAESLESIKTRANVFLDKHLAPVLAAVVDDSANSCVVVVSHGITLGVLALALLKKLGASSGDDPTDARMSWSNTGYVDLVVTKSPVSTKISAVPSSPWSRLNVKVSQINCTAHLNGLRKTRGGIGSAAHDEKQKTLDNFFVASSRKRKAKDAV